MSHVCEYAFVLTLFSEMDMKTYLKTLIKIAESLEARVKDFTKVRLAQCMHEKHWEDCPL